jgi:hypothetical protein
MLGERIPRRHTFRLVYAQLIRLAWSVESRTPVELPGVVAARYTSAAG